MGSAFSTKTFDGKLTAAELQQAYQKYVHECTMEYGSDPYNGSFSTLPTLQVKLDVFPNQQAADTHIADNTTKWEYALAVRYKDVRTEYVKKPTFNGVADTGSQISVVLGSECELEEPRTTYQCRAVVRMLQPLRPDAAPTAPIAAADQLTPSQKTKLVKLYNDFAARRKTFQEIGAELHGILERIKIVHQEPEKDDFSKIKKLHARRKKAWATLKKAAVKLRDADLKLSARLYKTEIVDHGTHWLVGGWCAT